MDFLEFRIIPYDVVFTMSRLRFYRQLLEQLMFPYCPVLLSTYRDIQCYCYIVGQWMTTTIMMIFLTPP